MIRLATTLAAALLILKVHVDGMVCSFCAQGLIKTFAAHASVERVSASLEEQTVTLTLKEGRKLGEKEIAELVEDAGYEMKSVETVKN